MDRHALVAGLVARPLRDGPGNEQPVEFKTEVVMQPGSRGFLNHEAQRLARLCAPAARFRGYGEIPLGPVFGKRVVSDFVHSDSVATKRRMCQPRKTLRAGRPA